MLGNKLHLLMSENPFIDFLQRMLALYDGIMGN